MARLRAPLRAPPAGERGVLPTTTHRAQEGYPTQNALAALQLITLCLYATLASAAVGAVGIAWIAAQFGWRRGHPFEVTDGLLFGAVGGAFAALTVAFACVARGVTDPYGSPVGAVLTAVLVGLVEGAVIGALTWAAIFLRERSRRSITPGRHN